MDWQRPLCRGVRRIAVALTAVVLIGASGCSVTIAALKHDPPLDADVASGTTRESVIERIGDPRRTEVLGEEVLDFYVIEEDKISENDMNLYAGLFGQTYGLSEIVAVPYVLLSDDSELALYVFHYNGDERLDNVHRRIITDASDSDVEIDWWLRGARAAHVDKARRASEREERRLRSEAAATHGDVSAAIVMAREFEDESYLRSLAERGEPQAAFALYERHWRDADTLKESWGWLCKAAASQMPDAQAAVGYWYQQSTWVQAERRTREELKEFGFLPDNRLAYIWFETAKANGAHSRYLPGDHWRNAALTNEELAEVRRIARGWTPEECPLDSSRLRGVSGYEQLLKGRPARRSYATEDGNVVATQLAELKARYERGDLSAEEYMQLQRVLINDHTQRVRNALPHY